MSLVTIIIPSYNNLQYLDPCVRSILRHQSTPGIFDVLIINNGMPGSIPIYNDQVKTIDAGQNLGWEGGLKKGLQNCSTPFVVFMNDDTFIPHSSAPWVYQMIQSFADHKVAAVGPSSNCVMGIQNIFVNAPIDKVFEVNFLIGFCVMVRRDALEKVGGVDDSLPYHGDDLDLSIRFREAGYKLLCDRTVFVYHHGFKTGTREFGDEWNSVSMTEKTNHHLIRKHGLKTFMKYCFSPIVNTNERTREDTEGEIIRTLVQGETLELGCGGQKTVSHAFGIDIIPRGEMIPGLAGVKSIADICADIKDPLPLKDEAYDTIIARHLLEHLLDPISVLKDWGRVLKKDGRLILAVPDQSKRNTIPLNYQHVHAYTQDSLKTLMESIGFKTEKIEDAGNDVSMVGVFRRNGLH